MWTAKSPNRAVAAIMHDHEPDVICRDAHFAKCKVFCRRIWLQLLEGSFKLIYKDGPMTGERMLAQRVSEVQRLMEGAKK